MKHDFIVIGSGLAGLTSALVLKEYGEVLLITKKELTDSASMLAQGGIAAVVDRNDTFASHIKDTLVAGAYHNKKRAVETLIKKSPQAIGWLIKQGVVFDKKDGEFSLTLEGGHSRRRILHSTDFSGRSIELALINKVKKVKNIEIWQDTSLLELLVRKNSCSGIQIIKHKKVANCYARAVILATGGIGQLYQWTTNPQVATADGLAVGIRADLGVCDLEFIQFHPTALKHNEAPLFLLSEALRGEGAYLIKIKDHPPAGGSKIKNYEVGDRFMHKVDRRAELAPRDIVARAIYEEQKKGNQVFLDIRHKGETFIKKRFPNLYREVKRRGYDMTKDCVPVTPAAHYSCGGVMTDLYGRTKIKNLFIFGETAYTGVQGANRLASNSLLEAAVFPLRLPEVIHEVKAGDYFDCELSDYKENIKTGNLREDIKKLMWKSAGIVRNHKTMQEAYEKLSEWNSELEKTREINCDFSEVKNMALVGKYILKLALNRKKSLGAHFVES